MSGKIASLRLDFGCGNTVPVVGHVCAWWKWNQPIEQGHQVQVVGRWTCADKSGMKAYPFVYPVTLVCHLLTGGPLGFLVLDDRVASPQEKRAMESEFSTCKNDNKALVVLEQLPGGRRCEFLLAPIVGHNRGTSVGVFGVYATSMKCGHFLLSRVIRKERIPLVLDLDETLVKAHTINQLEKKYEASRDAETRARLSEIEKDCDNLLYKDKLWVTRFAETEEMVIGGEAFKAQNVRGMYSSHDGNLFHDIIRPVIDLQSASEDLHKRHPLIENMFLTKILSDQKQTTVLARTRPGWKEAHERLTRATLSGEDDPRLAVEVFISTTAEKNYAHEIWRALDFDAAMIPENERSERIVAGMDRKNLAKSLRCLNPNPLVNPMPLAIILDDRTDVWDRMYHKQVLKSDIYDPYNPPHSDAARMKEQMDYFVDVILEARNRFFLYLKRQGLLLFGDSHPYKEFDVNRLEEEYFANLGGIPTMSDVLADITEISNGQETFERIEPLPSAMMAPTIETPCDPRRRHMSTKQEQSFSPSIDIFHEPEMADVPQTADTDPSMAFEGPQKEDKTAEDAGQTVSDGVSRDTYTQGGSLNSHLQAKQNIHERMNGLASAMGYVLSSKCEWLDGMNTATISIFNPNATTENKKETLIGMCSGVDAITAIAGASEAGLKYLENMSTMRAMAGDAQEDVGVAENEKDPQKARRWDVAPECSTVNQEHENPSGQDTPALKPDRSKNSEARAENVIGGENQSATPTKSKTALGRGADTPKGTIRPMKRVGQEGDAVKNIKKMVSSRESEKTQQKEEARRSGGSPGQSGSQVLDSKIYTVSNGSITCHVCHVTMPSDKKEYLQRHEQGRRHQSNVSAANRRARRESKQGRGMHSNSPTDDYRESVGGVRQQCIKIAEDMDIKLILDPPSFSKGRYEAKIHGDALSKKTKFVKRLLARGYGRDQDAARTDAYERCLTELRRYNQLQRGRRKRKL